LLLLVLLTLLAREETSREQEEGCPSVVAHADVDGRVEEADELAS
jgi:hypothetical protein